MLEDWTIHGSDCQCAQTLGVGALDLPPSTEAVVRRLLRETDRPDLLASLLSLRDENWLGLETRIGRRIAKAISVLARQQCPTKPLDESDVEIGWRTYYKTGLDSAADRWPDDWDGTDWSAWTARTLDLDSSESTYLDSVWRLVNSTVWGRPRHLTLREKAEYSLANRGDLWIDPAAQESHIRIIWERDESIRLLAAARATSTQARHLAHEIAARSGRAINEVLAYVAYLRQCDDGLIRPDERWL